MITWDNKNNNINNNYKNNNNNVLNVNGSQIEEMINLHIIDDVYTGNMGREPGHPEPGKPFGNI